MSDLLVLDLCTLWVAHFQMKMNKLKGTGKCWSFPLTRILGDCTVPSFYTKVLSKSSLIYLTSSFQGIIVHLFIFLHSMQSSSGWNVLWLQEHLYCRWGIFWFNTFLYVQYLIQFKVRINLASQGGKCMSWIALFWNSIPGMNFAKLWLYLGWNLPICQEYVRKYS